MNLSSFTNLFFYLFIFYQYFNYKYPEKTQEFMLIITYNSVYYFSKLQILIKKTINFLHLYLSNYEHYNILIAKIIELKQQVDGLLLNNQNNLDTVDFIYNNKVQQTINIKNFIEYLIDNKTVNNFNYCDIDFDFIIINGKSNTKKIIRKDELIFKSNEDNPIDYDVFLKNLLDIKSLNYKPMLCELIIYDEMTKIDFINNDKGYNFLVLDNSLDKIFLRYFMEKYYDKILIDDYILKVLNSSIEFIIFENTSVLKFDINDISKL